MSTITTFNLPLDNNQGIVFHLSNGSSIELPAGSYKPGGKAWFSELCLTHDGADGEIIVRGWSGNDVIIPVPLEDRENEPEYIEI